MRAVGECLEASINKVQRRSGSYSSNFDPPEMLPEPTSLCIFVTFLPFHSTTVKGLLQADSILGPPHSKHWPERALSTCQLGRRCRQRGWLNQMQLKMLQLGMGFSCLSLARCRFQVRTRRIALEEEESSSSCPLRKWSRATARHRSLRPSKARHQRR